MEKTRFTNQVPFMYFLFNWGVPVFISWNLFGCVVYAKKISEKWPDMMPDGCLTCKAFRPGGEPGLDFQEVDYTEQVLKALKND